MRKTILVVGMLAALLGLTGCFDDTSPEHALGTAAEAVKDGSVHELREIMEGRALEQYGNKAGLATLQHDLTGMKLGLGQKVRLWTKDHSGVRREWADSIEIFVKSANVDKWSRYKTATVSCEWYLGRRYTPRQPGMPEYQPDQTFCRIIDLN